MWKDLTMKEKAAMMKVAVNNGIYDIDKIKNIYDDGGNKGQTLTPGVWTTPANLVRNWNGIEYITDSEGNRKTVKEILASDPEYPIYTDIAGYPITGTSKDFRTINTETLGVNPNEEVQLNGIPTTKRVGDRIYNTNDKGVPYTLPFPELYYNRNNGILSELPLEPSNDIFDILTIGGSIKLPELINRAITSNTAKRLGKEAINYTSDIINFPSTLKAIKEHRYSPLMSKEEYTKYIREMHKTMDDAMNYSKEMAKSNFKKYRKTHPITESQTTTSTKKGPLSELNEWSPEKEISGMSTPTTYLKNHNNFSWKDNRYVGYHKSSFFPELDEITLYTSNTPFSNHSLMNKKDVFGIMNHEGNHFWSHVLRLIDPDYYTLQKPYKSYWAVNKDNMHSDVFTPLTDRKWLPSLWHKAPEEFTSEMANLKARNNVFSLSEATDKNMKDFSNFMAKRFLLKPSTAKDMMIKLDNRGFAKGGNLNKK